MAELIGIKQAMANHCFSEGGEYLDSGVLSGACKDGDIKSATKVGRSWLVDADEAAKYLANRPARKTRTPKPRTQGQVEADIETRNGIIERIEKRIAKLETSLELNKVKLQKNTEITLPALRSELETVKAA